MCFTVIPTDLPKDCASALKLWSAADATAARWPPSSKFSLPQPAADRTFSLEPERRFSDLTRKLFELACRNRRRTEHFSLEPERRFSDLTRKLFEWRGAGGTFSSRAASVARHSVSATSCAASFCARSDCAACAVAASPSADARPASAAASRCRSSAVCTLTAIYIRKEKAGNKGVRHLRLPGAAATCGGKRRGRLPNLMKQAAGDSCSGKAMARL